MTVNDAIRKIEKYAPGILDSNSIIEYLNELDLTIFEEYIKPSDSSATFEKYTAPDNTELLIPEPYSNIYIPFLESKAYYEVKDIDKYNNSLSVFEQNYKAMGAWYLRNHQTKKYSIKLF